MVKRSRGLNFSKKTAIIAAAITGICFIIGTIISSVCSSKKEIRHVVLTPSATSNKSSDQCKITINKFKVNYQINNKSISSSENSVIHANVGDILNLQDIEMNLSIENNCRKTSIAAEAYIRKQHIKNIDPNDKYDYEDGRFTSASMARRLFKSSVFTKDQIAKGWKLKSGFNSLVIVILQYSPAKPNGEVIQRFYFNIRL